MGNGHVSSVRLAIIWTKADRDQKVQTSSWAQHGCFVVLYDHVLCNYEFELKLSSHGDVGLALCRAIRMEVFGEVIVTEHEARAAMYSS